MDYYKVEERGLVPCPVNRIMEDGTSIFNYNQLPGPVLEGQGWKSAIVEDARPEYDPDIQFLSPWYEDRGTYIACRWEIYELPPAESGEMREALEMLGVKNEQRHKRTL